MHVIYGLLLVTHLHTCVPKRVQVVAELHDQASIVSERYVPEGTVIEAFCPPSLASRLKALGLLHPPAGIADISEEVAQTHTTNHG